MKEVTVYTALYDLNRESIDSRSFDIYVDWLRSTIKLFPGIVIFHDGQLDKYNLQNCILIHQPLNELQTFDFHNDVISTLQSFTPLATNDITFSLPSYALLQYAKFEFATLLENPAESVLWVDAGISRFIKSINLSDLDKSSGKLLRSGVDALFEIDVRNNFSLVDCKLEDAPIGSCRRVISGGSFWIKTAFLPTLYAAIRFEISTWLNEGKWDNEQVMLRKILPRIPGDISYVPQVSGIPGCVPRSLSNRRPKLYWMFQNAISKLLSRGLTT